MIQLANDNSCAGFCYWGAAFISICSHPWPSAGYSADKHCLRGRLCHPVSRGGFDRAHGAAPKPLQHVLVQVSNVRLPDLGRSGGLLSIMLP